MAKRGCWLRAGGSDPGGVVAALPDMNRPMSRWILAAILVGVFLVARHPRLIVLALVLLVGVAILRPRIKRYAQPPRR